MRNKEKKGPCEDLRLSSIHCMKTGGRKGQNIMEQDGMKDGKIPSSSFDIFLLFNLITAFCIENMLFVGHKSQLPLEDQSTDISVENVASRTALIKVQPDQQCEEEGKWGGGCSL